MAKYKIIGNMTGNSMDAIDLVLTEFDGDKMTDLCTYTKPYDKDMQCKMEYLRANVRQKTRQEILSVPCFAEIHDAYVRQVAACIGDMLEVNKIAKTEIDAIGFHGKTLDHNPPSVAREKGTLAYTLQIGSGQMLADLTGIRVIYDFRSAFLKAGFDGAPLAAAHNARVSAAEGDGCYYNGGNTSNFAWIIDGRAAVSSDAGPFNEYTDNFMRRYADMPYDKDGRYGKNGSLDKVLLQKLFDAGRRYYELPLPKSGDPQYYDKNLVFAAIERQYGRLDPQEGAFGSIVHTLEYFAAYVAVQALSLTDKRLKLPEQVVLFGGGWKNPVVRQSFERLLAGKGYVLPEHEAAFATFLNRFSKMPQVRYSVWGEFMEARLFADLARCYLEGKAWEIPEVIAGGRRIVCGREAIPEPGREYYSDMVNAACCGWQAER